MKIYYTQTFLILAALLASKLCPVLTGVGLVAKTIFFFIIALII